MCSSGAEITEIYILKKKKDKQTKPNQKEKTLVTLISRNHEQKEGNTKRRV